MTNGGEVVSHANKARTTRSDHDSHPHRSKRSMLRDKPRHKRRNATTPAPSHAPQGEEGGLVVEAGRNLHVEPTNPCLMRPTLAANPLIPDTPRPLNQQPRITLDPLGRAKDRATTRSRIAEYLQPERKLYAPQHDHSHNPPKPNKPPKLTHTPVKEWNWRKSQAIEKKATLGTGVKRKRETKNHNTMMRTKTSPTEDKRAWQTKMLEYVRVKS